MAAAIPERLLEFSTYSTPYVDCNDFSLEELKTIAELLAFNPHLKSLSTGFDRPSSEGFTIILGAAKRNSHLHSLCLASNLGPEHAKAIVELLEADTPLRSLILGGNSELGSAGFNAILGAARTHSYLTSLNLKACNLGPEHAKAIVELLEADTPLESLSLADNDNLGSQGLNTIIEAAITHSHLTSLDFSGHNLDPENIQTLITLLEVNTNITSVILNNNHPKINELSIRNMGITRETKSESTIERILINNIEIVLKEWGWGENRLTKPLDIIQLFFSPKEIEIYEKYLVQKSMKLIGKAGKKDSKEAGERADFKRGAEEIKTRNESEAAKKPVSPPTTLLKNRANLMQTIRSGMQTHRNILDHLSLVSKESGEVISKVNSTLQELENAIHSLKDFKGDVETQTMLQSCLTEFDSLRARVTRGSKYHQELTDNLLGDAPGTIPHICERNIQQASYQAQSNHQKAEVLVQDALKPLEKEKANYEELLDYLKQYLEQAQHLKSRVEIVARNRANLMQEISDGMQTHRNILDHLSQVSKESGEVISKVDSTLQGLEKAIESARNIKGYVETQTTLQSCLTEFDSLKAKLTRGSGYHQELTANLLGNAPDSIPHICERNIQQASHQAQGNQQKAKELVQEALKPLKKEEANYEELLVYLKQYLEQAQHLKSRVEAMVAKAVTSTTPMQDLAKNSPDDHVGKSSLQASLKSCKK